MLLFHFMILVAIAALFLVVLGAFREFRDLWETFHQNARHSHFAGPKTR